MRIAAAMSGGVDSSVAAYLLSQEGHEVVGLTLKVWDDSRCCSIDDADDARAVARKLGIPHFVIDAREAFEEEVIKPFLDICARGETPNPCVLCNRRLKFEWLADRARILGCDGLATGHYARILADGSGHLGLYRGIDLSKDQSYFVVPDTREQLGRLLFPLGGYSKEEIRRIAAQIGLSVAGKPDSQDLCFVPRGGIAEFISSRAGKTGGEIVDLSGRVLGTHDGLCNYTIGQRKGLGISSPEPLYVVRKDLEAGRLVLGGREALFGTKFSVSRAVWLEPEASPEGFSCEVKTRSTAEPTPCRVAVEGEGARVVLEKPVFAITPGQLAVFYAGEKVIGSGWIVSG